MKTLQKREENKTMGGGRKGRSLGETFWGLQPDEGAEKKVISLRLNSATIGGRCLRRRNSLNFPQTNNSPRGGGGELWREEGKQLFFLSFDFSLPPWCVFVRSFSTFSLLFARGGGRMIYAARCWNKKLGQENGSGAEIQVAAKRNTARPPRSPSLPCLKCARSAIGSRIFCMANQLAQVHGGGGILR